MSGFFRATTGRSAFVSSFADSTNVPRTRGPSRDAPRRRARNADAALAVAAEPLASFLEAAAARGLACARVGVPPLRGTHAAARDDEGGEGAARSDAARAMAMGPEGAVHVYAIVRDGLSAGVRRRFDQLRCCSVRVESGSAGVRVGWRGAVEEEEEEEDRPVVEQKKRRRHDDGDGVS